MSCKGLFPFEDGNFIVIVARHLVVSFSRDRKGVKRRGIYVDEETPSRLLSPTEGFSGVRDSNPTFIPFRTLRDGKGEVQSRGSEGVGP